MTQLCVKCDEQTAIILVGTNGSFCRECFEKYFTHKFRAALGKNPIVRHGDKVAVAYSGGNCSSALLHVMLQSLSPTAFKRLKFTPGVIFIDESVVLPDDNYECQIADVKKLLEETCLPFHIVRLEEVLAMPQMYSDLDSQQMKDSAGNLKALFSSVKTLTSKEELLYRLRCKLLAYKAKEFGYQHIFLGETSTRLSINILSNLAQGRGAQLASDTRFTDEGRYFGINLLRPMRDISAKEVAVYNNIHKVRTIFFPTLSTKARATASIQRLTEDFVVTLSADFPATETTVFRTSNKLATAKTPKTGENHEKTCCLCHGKIASDVSGNKASALKALDFTEKLSLGEFGTPSQPNLQTLDSFPIVCETKDSELVLCHCCKIIKKDLHTEDSTEKILERVVTKKWTEKEMVDKLNGILLES